LTNASAKPSLSLVEARNRLGIFSKAFQEDKLFGNVYNIKNNKNLIDENHFSNLKSIHKKKLNGKSSQGDNDNNALSVDVNNDNNANDSFITDLNKNESEINYLNKENELQDDDSEYLRKLRKIQDVENCNEMIEEFDNEEDSRIEVPSCSSNIINETFLSTRSITETPLAKILNSIESNDTGSYNNLAKKDSDEDEGKKKKLPEDVNLFDLAKKYPELLNFSRIKKPTSQEGNMEFDFEKFKRLVEEEMNLLVPLNKKNDEVFKRKVIVKKIYNDKFSENQSAKRSDTHFKKKPQELLDSGNFRFIL